MVQPSLVNVIEEIEHDQEAAVRDEEVASVAVRIEADEAWAAVVERRMHQADHRQESDDNMEIDLEEVFLDLTKN